MVDPDYWKQQYFLAGRLVTFIPMQPGAKKAKRLTAMELAFSDAKYVGYLVPKKEQQEKMGVRVDSYIALAEELSDDTKDKFDKQGQLNNCGTKCLTWTPGEITSGLKQESVDFVFLGAGATAGLGEKAEAAFAEARRAVKREGRLILVAEEADEAALAGSFEAILDAQSYEDEMEELEGLELEESQTEAGKVVRASGWRLANFQRDECGLGVGVFVPWEPKKARRKAMRAPKAKTGSKGSRSPSRSPSRGPGAARGGSRPRRQGFQKR